MENDRLNTCFKVQSKMYLNLQNACATGAVVSCKIPILATWVRFPGGELPFEMLFLFRYLPFYY